MIEDPGRALRDAFISSHLHLCRRAARRFARPGLEQADLQQVAAVALTKAAQRYDASRAVPFEAFAWLTILGELMNFVRDNECIVRIPRSLREQRARYFAAREDLLGHLEREPSDAECSEILNVPVRIVRRVRLAHELHFVSQTKCGSDAIEAIPDQQGADFEDAIMLRDAFAALCPLERRVVAGLYLVGVPAARLARYLELEPRQVATLRRRALLQMRTALDGAGSRSQIA